jgi:RNA polymerase sigma-70 factor (ECF subfamily)
MMQDDQIVELYRQRDEAAIKETAQKYGSYCYRIAYDILHSEQDAEECVNDVYMRAWESIPPNEPERLSTYLGKLTRNVALNRYVRDHAQKRNAEADVVFDEVAYLIPDESEGHIIDEMLIKACINRFVGSLPKQTRVVFVRRYWYMHDVKTIAASMGLGESNVKIMLLRTRKKLKAFLKKEGIIV